MLRSFHDDFMAAVTVSYIIKPMPVAFKKFAVIQNRAAAIENLHPIRVINPLVGEILAKRALLGVSDGRLRVYKGYWTSGTLSGNDGPTADDRVFP
jgi:hypothetical protein